MDEKQYVKKEVHVSEFPGDDEGDRGREELKNLLGKRTSGVDPVAKRLLFADERLNRYFRYLQDYQYPTFARVPLCLWYSFYLYFLVITIFFPLTSYSDYVVPSSHFGSAKSIVKNIVESFEIIAPETTNFIPTNLFDDLSNESATYYIYNFGTCKENANSEFLCSRSDTLPSFLLKDFAGEASKGRTEDVVAAFDSAIDLVSSKIEEHTICVRGSLFNIFGKSCTVEGLDPRAVSVFHELKPSFEQVIKKKLWWVSLLLFLPLLVIDLYGWLVLVNVEFLSFWWGLLCYGNLMSMFTYVIWSLDSGSSTFNYGRPYRIGRLFYILLALLGLQAVSGLAALIVWVLKMDRRQELEKKREAKAETEKRKTSSNESGQALAQEINEN